MRDAIDWTRKPMTWDEITDVEIPEDLQARVDSLPHIELDGDDLPGPDANLEDYVPDYRGDILFVLVIGGARFLINTEGYEYARYAARI